MGTGSAEEIARAAHARTFRHVNRKIRPSYYPPRSLSAAELEEWHLRLYGLLYARGRPPPPEGKGIAEFRALLAMRHDPHVFDHFFKEPTK